MNFIRTGIREGVHAACSPGILWSAAGYALVWGLGWWLAAPVVQAGFAIGAPADATTMVQLWTLGAGVIAPLLVLGTVLDPDRSGLLEWRLSGPIRPLGLAISLLVTSGVALLPFALPLVPIVAASLIHQASAVTVFGNLALSITLLIGWTAIVIAATVWLRSALLTLLATLMIPLIGLGAVAALPILADRAEDAGVSWLSTTLVSLANLLAQNHPIRLARGLLDGQLEWASLLNVALIAVMAVLVTSEGLRVRAFEGRPGLRRHLNLRIVGFGLGCLSVFVTTNRFVDGSFDLTPLGRATASPRLVDAAGELPPDATIFLSLDGDVIPNEDLLFASRLITDAASGHSLDAFCVDLAELRRGEVSSRALAAWRSAFRDSAARLRALPLAMQSLEAALSGLSSRDHAEVILGGQETLRRVRAGLQRGVVPDHASAARQLSVALQQVSAVLSEPEDVNAMVQHARELILLADDDSVMSSRLFTGSGGLAIVVDGEIRSFTTASSLLVQTASNTRLRGESVLCQAIEEFNGTRQPEVTIMVPPGSEPLAESIAYELQLRGLRVASSQPESDPGSTTESVLLVVADPPLAVESDPTGLHFVRQVASRISNPEQDAVLCVGPSIRSRYKLASPWEELMAVLGTPCLLDSALGESVTRRGLKQTDLLIRPDWRSDHAVATSLGSLPIAFPLAVDLGTDQACIQWLPAARRGRVSNWTAVDGEPVRFPDPMGLVKLTDDGSRRLAIVGSARWLSPSLRTSGLAAGASSGNYELASSLIRWSSGRDAMGLGPDATLGRFQPSALERLLWVSFAAGIIPFLLASFAFLAGRGRAR